MPFINGIGIILSVSGSLEQSFDIVRSFPHGHVACVLGTLRKTGLDTLLGSKQSRNRQLAIAMIVQRIIDPNSKLATARALDKKTQTSSLATLLGLEDVSECELYQALDWLLKRQGAIEKGLAKKHLQEGCLLLYDVTSSYFEGHCCPLAQYGYNRDGKHGKEQIVIGLLCNAQGCPIAVEVFEGNMGDPTTLANQIQKVREKFAIQRVIWVADRGLITQSRIQEALKKTEGLSWISALRAPAIQDLVARGDLQMSLFDERDLAEIYSEAFPGERLIVCRNPLLAQERQRKREELLAETEKKLDQVVSQTQSKRLQGKDKIGLRVGKVLGKFKMGKHFSLQITETSFSYSREQEKIEKESRLDGVYVIRTSLNAEILGTAETVQAYKGLAVVESAFRRMKTVDLQIRPIYLRLAQRVKAHVLLCMLAYYVEWHLRQAWAPILFQEDDKLAALDLRQSVVAPAKRSPKAQKKAQQKQTEEGLPVHSFQTLIQDLATLTLNSIQPRLPDASIFHMLAQPTTLQLRAFQLLSLSPNL